MFVLEKITYKNILKIDLLKIPSKKVTCIVGESGVGKTTLLKMLNLMISPDKGIISYQNKNLFLEDPIVHRRRVVMATQQPAIFEGTIRDNLTIGLIYSEKLNKTDEELLNMLHLVSLKKKLDEDAETLSGGEKQRLALARICLMEPEVFLLDEPTSALDEETESTVMENFIQFSKRKQQTIILITHSPKIAQTYGENIVKLERRGLVDNDECN